MLTQLYDRKRIRLLARGHGARRSGITGLSAASIGFFGLVSGWDAALAWSFVAFSAYVLLAIVVYIAVSSAKPGPTTSLAVPADPLVELNELASTTQTLVLTLTATVLGLLTAFATESLDPATKAAVIALVTAVLVQLVVHASGARRTGHKGAMWVATYGDFVASSSFAFGLIALAAALLDRS